MEHRHFATPEEFREWLAANHATATELGVILHSRASGKPTMTWSEAVDEALCYGWIDSVVRRLDATTRVQRFTPRRPRSNWSAVNIRKMTDLTARGLVAPAGAAAFALREEARSAVYSFETRGRTELDAAGEAAFRARPEAWMFFSSQPAGYRRTCIHHVMSAVREATRSARLDRLIAASEAGQRLARW